MIKISEFFIAVTSLNLFFRGASPFFSNPNLTVSPRMGHGIPWYLPISVGRFLQILRLVLTPLCVKSQSMGNVKNDISMNIRGFPPV